jgi:hypothetical protein
MKTLSYERKLREFFSGKHAKVMDKGNFLK